jgi:hypothetical protein
MQDRAEEVPIGKVVAGMYVSLDGIVEVAITFLRRRDGRGGGGGDGRVGGHAARKGDLTGVRVVLALGFLRRPAVRGLH